MTQRTDVDMRKMRSMEQLARSCADKLDGTLNAAQSITGAKSEQGKTYAFALIVTRFDGPELTYVSNAERAEMTQMLRELLEHWERGSYDDFHSAAEPSAHSGVLVDG